MQIYDLLHLRVARKLALERIYTFNETEWKALAPELVSATHHCASAVGSRAIWVAALRKQTSPPSLAARRGRRWGMGVRHTLFPMPTLGATQVRGRRLPDAILHGKRSFRPRSRAVQRVSATGLLSEAFQLAATDGCAIGLRTKSRHVCDLRRVLTA